MGRTGRARVVVLLVAVAGAGGGGGCAHQAGANATAGALQGLQQQSEQQKAETGQYIVETLGDRTTKGVIARATSPESMAMLEQAAGQLSAAAVQQALATATEGGADSPIGVASTQAATAFEQALVRALSDDLGAHGDGPLGSAMADVSERIARASARGIAETLSPGCDLGDAGCLDRRVSELARASASGFVSGLGRVIPWLLAAVMFVAGVLVTLLVLATLSLLRRSGGGTEAGARRGPRRAAPRDLATTGGSGGP
jgi:hypothetical protein